MAGPKLWGNTWIFQDRAPQDILAHHKGTKVSVRLAGEVSEVTIGTQLKKSLGTSDKATAQERYRDLSAQLGEAYACLRQAQTQGPVRLTDRQCDELAGEYFKRTKATYSEDNGGSTWDALLDALDLHGATAKGREAFHGEAASRLLTERGIITTAESRERLLLAMHRAFLDAGKRIYRWAETGDYGPMQGGEEQYPTVPVTKVPPALTLAMVREAYIKDRRAVGKDERKMIDRFRSFFDPFVAHVGGEGRDANSITPEEVESWLEALEKRGLERRTIKDSYLSAVRAALRQSARRLTSDPLKGVKVNVPKVRRTRPKGFTKEEATAILRTAKASTDKPGRRKDHIKRARRWVPWICAHTGARVGEITQLRKEDFKEVNGIRYVHITPEAGSTKTGNDRFVPLHPQLIAEGLWQAVQEAKPGPLFHIPGGKTEGTNNRIREMVRKEAGVTDPKVQPNHAWRHRFITEARGRMDSETRDRITGHEDGRAAAGYGETELVTLAAAIEAMPAFDLTEPERPI
jgi:integrase